MLSSVSSNRTGKRYLDTQEQNPQRLCDFSTARLLPVQLLANLKVSPVFPKVCRLPWDDPRLRQPQSRPGGIVIQLSGETVLPRPTQGRRASSPQDSLPPCHRESSAELRCHLRYTRKGLAPGTFGSSSLFFSSKPQWETDAALIRQRELRFAHPAPGTLEKAGGGLTEGCHISSAGSGLPSHTCGCTCSRRPRGSSLRPRAPGWVSCSRTPPRGTTETQQGGKAAHSRMTEVHSGRENTTPPKAPNFHNLHKSRLFRSVYVC